MRLQALQKEIKREIIYATDDEKLKYGYQLTEFTKTLKHFVEDFRIKKVKMKNINWKFESNKIEIPEDYSNFFNQFSDKEGHIELIDKQLERMDLDGKLEELETEVKLIPQ